MKHILKRTLQQFGQGLFTRNPVLIQLLGLCPTLAVTTSLENGVGMGLAATAVLACSNIIISALRKLIPQKIRIACYVVIIATFVTVVDLLLQAYRPELSASLGVFIPLIVVNCMILARAEAFASKNGVFASAIDGLTMGLGFTLALGLLGAFREILGTGAIAGVPVFGEGYTPVLFFILPAGGFLALAVVIALFQTLVKKIQRKRGAKRS